MSGTLEVMDSRTLRLPLLALATVAALSACTAQTPPTATGGTGAAGGGDVLPTITPVVDPAAVLQVADQKSEGPTVLAKAAATKGGFIVVYGDGGRNELGSGRVEPGTTPQDVQISLAEEPTEQLDLIARLYADTDGNGLYGAPDLPVTNGEDDQSDDAEAFGGEQETFSFQGKPVSSS
jgi:hypothetical protein